MAVHNSKTGELVGISRTTDSLENAFANGAPAWLVDRAYRMRATQEDAGPAGSDRWFWVTFRLHHEISELNRLLYRYTNGRQVLSTATHRGRNRHGLSVRETDLADIDRHTALAGTLVRGERPASPTRGHDPPPLTAATTTPIMRTGPPACRRHPGGLTNN